MSNDGVKIDNVNDYLLKEIDLIEKCIERMAKNSFEIRKWTVGLISIISGMINVADKKATVLFLCIIIICSFWYLDAYYLRYERMYIAKYNWIIQNRNSDRLLGLLDLNPRNQYLYNVDDMHKIKKYDIKIIMCSNTLRYFYGVLLIGVMIVYGLT